MSSRGAELCAVVDANLVVSAQIKRGNSPARVLDAWLAGAFELATSPDLLDELANVLWRPRIRLRYDLLESEMNYLLAMMRLGLVDALPIANLPIHCRDPKDDKVLAAALGAGADYIVTGDADLLALDGQPALGPLRIVTPAAFLEILAGKS